MLINVRLNKYESEMLNFHKIITRRFLILQYIHVTLIRTSLQCQIEATFTIRYKYELVNANIKYLLKNANTLIRIYLSRRLSHILTPVSILDWQLSD